MDEFARKMMRRRMKRRATGGDVADAVHPWMVPNLGARRTMRKAGETGSGLELLTLSEALEGCAGLGLLPKPGSFYWVASKRNGKRVDGREGGHEGSHEGSHARGRPKRYRGVFTWDHVPGAVRAFTVNKPMWDPQAEEEYVATVSGCQNCGGTGKVGFVDGSYACHMCKGSGVDSRPPPPHKPMRYRMEVDVTEEAVQGAELGLRDPQKPANRWRWLTLPGPQGGITQLRVAVATLGREMGVASC